MNFKSICNEFEIDEVDNELDLAKGLKAMLNKVKKSKESVDNELEEAKAEFKKKKEEMDALEMKCNNLEEEMNAFKNKAEEEAKNFIKIQATNLVDIHVKRGAITSESVEKWVNMASNDLDSAKEMLESIAPSKQAPSKIEADVKVANQWNGEAVVNSTMANLRAKFNI